MATAALAQSPGFEVASVKLSSPPDYAARVFHSMSGGPGSADPGRWTCDHYPLLYLIQFAYDLQPYQFSGPSWLENTHVAIVAKVPAGATRDTLRVMLQNLLTERFRMTVRREKKEVPGFELIVDKGGPKLQESKPLAPGQAEPAAPAVRPRATLAADGYPDIPEAMPVSVTMTLGVRARSRYVREGMDVFARSLSGLVEKPVINATGLAGKYDFSVYWIQDRGVAMPPPGGTPASPAEDTAGPTIFRAIQDQLGLKMEARKVTVDLVTVERAERTPIEN